jgi:hypothetical protein
VIPLLADHGGEEVRRYDEVLSMTMLHSACHGSKGEKQRAATFSAPKGRWSLSSMSGSGGFALLVGYCFK